MERRPEVNLILSTSADANAKGSSFDVTQNISRSWKRSIRDMGGFWVGTAEWIGSTAEMKDIFENCMMGTIKEVSGGGVTWEGFVAEMMFYYRGNNYTRSWIDLANKVKVVYSKMGNNLITYNSNEVVANLWAAYGSPSTRERSSVWATKGSYSIHVVTDAADEGVTIQSSISVTAGKQYQAHVTINIISGVWRLEIYNSSGIIDYMDQEETGQSVIYVGILPEDQVSGTVGLRLLCTDATGECYADAAVFQEIADRAETGWAIDENSVTEYGTIEYVESKSGMTDAAANALATKLLKDKAWARIEPPAQIEQVEKGTRDRLVITVLGFVFTLKNFYSDYAGTEDTASVLIREIVDEAEFVRAGTIETNSLSFHVEDSSNVRAWDLIREITEAGDASGNRWTCGVYTDREFRYQQASNAPVARIRGGMILSADGGPLEGWLAEPGLVGIDEGLLAYDINDRPEDRSNASWMGEVEFDLGEYIKGGDGVKFRKAV